MDERYSGWAEGTEHAKALWEDGAFEELSWMKQVSRGTMGGRDLEQQAGAGCHRVYGFH